MTKGSIAGLLPTVVGKKSTAKTPPSSYIRIYRNREDATFPDLLYPGETEQQAFIELTGTSSPSEMKRALLTLRRLLKEGTVKMSVETEKPAKKK